MKTILATPAKFSLGQIYMTANAQRRLSAVAVSEAIFRHAAGDWGEVCAEDAGLNDQAIRHGSRLLSVYKEGTTSFWIITEADRSATTVLMPEDY